MLRMGAQIVSGVGFLGAGSIILDDSRNKIRGITTAAGLWTTACLGIVVGSGYYLIAGVMLLIMVVVMWGLKPLGKKLNSRIRGFRVKIICDDISSKEIINSLEDGGFEIKRLNIDSRDGDYIYIIDVLAENSKVGEGDIAEVLAEMKAQVEILPI